VTRGQLPQRAGLPGLNRGGAAAAVTSYVILNTLRFLINHVRKCASQTQRQLRVIMPISRALW